MTRCREWEPGQRVRCVDTRGLGRRPALTEGVEYVVADVKADRVNIKGFPLWSFLPERFKPVVRVPWVLAS